MFMSATNFCVVILFTNIAGKTSKICPSDWEIIN